MKVGTQTLSSTAYNADTTVNSTSFGNGGKVANSYDSFKRVTGIRIDSDTQDRYRYDYGVHGEIARVTDNLLNRQATSEYDLANRPMRITRTEGGSQSTNEQGGNQSTNEQGSHPNDSSSHLYTGEVAYDGQSNLQKFTEKVGTAKTAYETTYTYDNENRPTAVQYGSADNQTAYTYDAIGRVNKKTLTLNGQAHEIGYTFESGGHGEGSTTSLVKRISQAERQLNYTYDDVGNIVSAELTPAPMLVKTSQGLQVYAEKWNPQLGAFDANKSMPFFLPADPAKVTKVTYVYDRLGQLTRANEPRDTTAGETGTTWVYEYDRGGNMQCKKAYAYTTGTIAEEPIRTYVYSYTDNNWKDKLTAFDGQSITYDPIGNPLDDGIWQYEWQAGRQLKSMVKVGTGNEGETGASIATGSAISYAYNADGLRIRKTVTTPATSETVPANEGTTAKETATNTQTSETVTTNYTLHGKNIVHLTQGSNSLHFYYDAQNRVSQVDFNGTRYAYLHNLQGDIIAIVDASGGSVVEYSYDAWGRPIQKAGTLASTLGMLNPFRYRGYVYDEETGMYYLRSRYYSPVSCRFLNADTLLGKTGALSSHNAFCYCRNMPIDCADHAGMDLDLATLETIYNYGIEMRNSTNVMKTDVYMERIRSLASHGYSYARFGCAHFIAHPMVFGTSATGMTTMFDTNCLVSGSIEDIGGSKFLLEGMIVAIYEPWETDPYTHGGVYADYRNFKRYSSQKQRKSFTGTDQSVFESTPSKGTHLGRYGDQSWTTWMWHKGLIPSDAQMDLLCQKIILLQKKNAGLVYTRTHFEMSE